jgi:hypothetical protein
MGDDVGQPARIEGDDGCSAGMGFRRRLADAPRTVLYEFAKIKSGDIVLPAESSQGARTTVRLQHVSEPEAEQKTLLQRIGLTLPRRLKRIDRPAHVR